MRTTDEPRAFGRLLRQYRLAANLTQEALAERAGVGVRSIQALESGARLPLRDTLHALTKALGLVSEHQSRLTSAARPAPRRRKRPVTRQGDRSEDPSDDSTLAAPNNLPIQWTTFVGREDATNEVRRLLKSAHLLTLTGAGGCGKTRLALEVAKGRLDAYPDGLWLIDLAPLNDPTLVAQTAASAMGVREYPGEPILQTLTRHLRVKRELLVFDNCEHVIESSAHVIDAILQSCSEVRVLATSREALRITGEVSWRVPSLAVPPPIGDRLLAVDEVESFEAARLFIDRAGAVEPGFRLTAENVAAVIQICRHLDGMPLAIELAAARVSALGVQEIAARLDDRFRLLTEGSRTAGPRQQTLRATVDWSYDLLPETERVLLRRLAVFVGGWTLAAAEAIGTGGVIADGDVVYHLSRLVDKSLVTMDQDVNGSRRYRLLETLRQYLLERLAESGEVEATQCKHATHYLELTEEAAGEWYGPDQTNWFDRLEAERPNLRAALQWHQHAGDWEAATRMGAALGTFWNIRGPLTEGQERLEEILAAPTAAVSDTTRALALMYLAALYQRRGEHDTASARFTESLAIRRALGDRRGEGRSLASLGNVEVLQERYARAQQFLAESLAIARELDDRWAIGFSLENLGHVALMRDELETARHGLEEALAIAHERGDRRRVYHAQHLLGSVALAESKYTEARSRFHEALATARDGNDQTMVGVMFADLASLAAAEKKPKVSIRLAGAAAARREVFGARTGPAWTTWYGRWIEPAHQMLSEDARASAWSEGQAMTLEQAIAYALDESAG